MTASSYAGYAFGTDTYYTTSADVLASAVADSGHTAYRYLFNQTMTTSVLRLLGSFHSLELPFIFNSYTAFGTYLGDSNWTPTAADLLLAQQIQEYVV